MTTQAKLFWVNMKPKVPNILMKKNPSFLHCISTIYLRACPKGKTYIGASINILTHSKVQCQKIPLTFKPINLKKRIE